MDGFDFGKRHAQAIENVATAWDVNNWRSAMGRPICRFMLTLLLAASHAGALGMNAFAAVTCKPILSIKNVREIRTPNLQPWTWKATIIADLTYCATANGFFEIDFVRIKEYSPDIQFTEKFSWMDGQFELAMELVADEAILDYRIGFIAPCVCRTYPH